MSEETKNTDLETYLQDHYAGAVGALELIEHLRKAHEDEDDLERFFRTLQTEIEADHEQLHNVMTALRFEPSSVCNAGAWMAEKLARVKIGFPNGEGNLLRLLQALESIYAGIMGKRLLWRALHAARDSSPVLRSTDFSLLEQRAIEQAERIESKRLSLARRALEPQAEPA